MKRRALLKGVLVMILISVITMQPIAGYAYAAGEGSVSENETEPDIITADDEIETREDESKAGTLSSDAAERMAETPEKDAEEKEGQPVSEETDEGKNLSDEADRSGEAVSENAVSENTVPKNTVSKNTVSDNTVSENTVSENAPISTLKLRGAKAAAEDDWYNYWYYVLDTEDNYIILITYGYDADGNKIPEAPKEVVVPATAVIGGITYHSVILNNGSMQWSNDSETISSSHSPFCDNADITSVKFEDKVYTGMTFDLTGMFSGCTSLASVDLSGLYCDNGPLDECRFVCSAEQAFRNCRSLNKIDFGEIRFDECYSMREMFCGCESLTGLDLSDWNTAETVYFNGMFSNCLKLKELDISGFTIGSRTIVRDMLAGDKALIRIKTPKAFKSRDMVLFPREMCVQDDNADTVEKTFPSLRGNTPADTWLIPSCIVTYETSSGRKVFTEKVRYGRDAGKIHAEYTWFTASDLKTQADLKCIEENTTVYTADMYSIRYHYNDGTDDYEDEIKPVSEKNVTIPSYKRKKDGKSITGWNADAAGAGEIYEIGDTYPLDAAYDGFILDLYAMYGDPDAIKGTFSVSVPALIILEQDEDGYLEGSANVTVTGKLRKNDYVEVKLSDFDMSNRSETINVDVNQTKSRWTTENISGKTADISMRSREAVTGAGNYNGHSVLTIRSGSSVD